MRILTKNILENNSSIVMTNPDTAYQVESLYNNMLEDIVQASGGTTTITVGFDTDQVIDSFFFGYHNSTSMSVIFKDSGGAILLAENFVMPAQRVRAYIEQLTTVRSIEITLNTAAGHVFLGSFSAGVHTQVVNVNKPFLISYTNTSRYEQTDGGQVLFRPGVTLATFNIALSKNTDVEAAAFKAAYDAVLSGKAFWLDRNEDLITRLPFFGFFSGDLATSENNEFTDISTEFTEAK